MKESKVNLGELLHEAMESEIKAMEFYKNASMKAHSHAGKQFFKELAGFESNHYKQVKHILELHKEGLSVEISNKEQALPLIGSEVKGEIESNCDEIVGVINLAIKSEENAQRLYKQLADMFEDKRAEHIFNTLAADERNHQKILEDQFYHLSNKGTIIWE
jgi:rubrerythrin